MTTLYGLKNCSTCKKATKWLDEQGIGYTFIDYRQHPIDPALLLQWAEQLGGWPKLINRASPTWRQLPPERKEPATDAEWQALVADFPTLVRRPVTVTASSVWVGFKPDVYAQQFA